MIQLVPLLPGLEAHPSSALWLPESRTAILADVHLGYSWAQRRRGELGPLADFRAREKLLSVFDQLRPEQVVFLGDLVHAPRPCEPEREWIENLLVELSHRARLIAVRGNHDRAFSREFGHLPLTPLEFWSNDNLIAVHGDRLPAAPIGEKQTLIAGHLHPCLSIRDAAGAGRKMPVFLANSRCIVLPAFSPFARGYDLVCGIPGDLLQLFGSEPVEAYVASNSRIARLGPLRRALDKMWQADRSAPENFRRRTARQ